MFWLLNAKREEVEYYLKSQIGSPTEKRYMYYYFQRYFYNSKDTNLAFNSICQGITELDKDPDPSKKFNDLDYLILGGDGAKHKLFKTYKHQYVKKTAIIGNYKILKVIHPSKKHSSFQ